MNYKELLCSIGLVAGLFLAGQALAKDDDDDEPKPGAAVQADRDDDDDEAEGPELSDVFGFTEGSDTDEAGERELSLSLVSRWSRLAEPNKRDPRYAAHSVAAEFEYAVTDDLQIAVGGLVDAHDVHSIYDLENRSNIGFNGVFAEATYRVLDRESAPFGLAFSIEPGWQRYEEGSGERQTSLSLGLGVKADAILIPDVLFGALNLEIEPEWAREGRRWEREAGLTLSGAVSTRVAEGTFVGGELRFLSTYEGLFEKNEGRALYLGPTFFQQLTDSAYLRAAFSVQVAGHAAERPRQSLDLVNFDRYQLLVQVGSSF